MQRKHLIIAVLLASFSLTNTTWHERTAREAAEEKAERERFDCFSDEDYEQAREAERERVYNAYRIRQIAMQREINMKVFRLGKFDSSCPVSMLPLDMINYIHQSLKEIEE